MATRPSQAPRWAETATGTPAANITVPLSGEQDAGFNNGQTVVSSGKVNWLFRTIYDWCLYVADAVFVAATGSGLPGVTATGDGASPGVKAIPGGGATPARGALNLATQTAPTAPADGDLWYDGTGFFVRLAGATRTFLAATIPQVFSGTATRGAVNLAGQATPSTPSDGDLWYDTTTLAFSVRSNGQTMRIDSEGITGAGSTHAAAYGYGNANTPAAATIGGTFTFRKRFPSNYSSITYTAISSSNCGAPGTIQSNPSQDGGWVSGQSTAAGSCNFAGVLTAS